MPIKHNMFRILDKTFDELCKNDQSVQWYKNLVITSNCVEMRRPVHEYIERPSYIVESLIETDSNL